MSQADRISIADDDEIFFWAENFGVTPDCLKRAVVEVGTTKNLIEQYFQRTKDLHSIRA